MINQLWWRLRTPSANDQTLAWFTYTNSLGLKELGSGTQVQMPCRQAAASLTNCV